MKKFDIEKIIGIWAIICVIVVFLIFISVAIIYLGNGAIGEKMVCCSALALEFQIIVGIVLFVSDLF